MTLDKATVDRLAEMFAAGASNKAARRELGIGVDTAARYRAKLGYPPAKQTAPPRSPLTLTEKWATHTRPAEDGHMQWTGRHRPDTGTRVFTHHGREYTARAVAFRIRTGRDPIGYVTAECDHPGCVAPACMEDEPGRTRTRAALADIRGFAAPPDQCTAGHPTAEHWRYERDGRGYCAACHTTRARARKDAA
ncbi:hypothetical protein [Streptomyces griseoloalbus]|uniref:Ribosomal protein L13E n=1 Tax=Streptomyces griseoloalbus TaxID=67303 RepID=A0A7W8F9T7_9ACTN|nr:hypothetical protein [Streptomyces albaduncus]MBB5128478.1 ribosomal protein L13E [Streptomyces albaduncus]GGW68197.1 hypothetical protein GCM10010340_52900 [Streptomyces albaduncus]